MYLILNDISYYLFYLFLLYNHCPIPTGPSQSVNLVSQKFYAWLRRSIVRLSTHVILAAFPCARRKHFGIPAFHPASWAPAAPVTHLKRPFIGSPVPRNSIVRGPLCRPSREVFVLVPNHLEFVWNRFLFCGVNDLMGFITMKNHH